MNMIEIIYGGSIFFVRKVGNKYVITSAPLHANGIWFPEEESPVGGTVGYSVYEFDTKEKVEEFLHRAILKGLW